MKLNTFQGLLTTSALVLASQLAMAAPTFKLADSDGGEVVRVDSESAIRLDFVETFNRAKVSQCAAPNPLVSNCDDYLILGSTGLEDIEFFC
jgi:hypothetical protein